MEMLGTWLNKKHQIWVHSSPGMTGGGAGPEENAGYSDQNSGGGRLCRGRRVRARVSASFFIV